ncbi:substrate-binding domain-containing protein [Pedosphaera parvula]|uniref:Regulatory protein GntR HTH n=1 Tax=Pedosphaera parvula (strain Ellin514) TaxID=320771 RepID=B9XD07_PEDPL|nr:substrate-binding domain-containing protein [Pedosphaera parvula]EEF62353.1 regulatory protein GntR HTH [Pedosphaera parvula Ellin514]
MSLLVPKRVSLSSQVADILRDGMMSGIWTEWLPGERLLCERLKVSRPTLRAALEKLEKEGWLRVDSTRCRRILRPALAGKQVTNVVGLLTPLPLYAVPPLTLFWIDELRDHLTEAGYRLEIHYGERFYRENPKKSLAGLVQQTRAAGWVLWLSSARMQRWFSEQKVPCLLMGSSHHGISLPSLDLDQRAVCRHAVSQFYARGHQRIAFIIHTGGFAGDLESVEGVHEAHTQFAPAAPAPEIVWHDSSPEGIVHRLDALFASSRPPTAFLVARSAAALTVVGYLLKRGLRFPKDALLISRDHDPFLEYMVPTVARYALNPRHYAKVASRMVIQLASGMPLLQKEIRLTPELVKGETFS